MALDVERLRALLSSEVEACDEQDAENDLTDDEPLDFGGNQDDALSFGVTRGNRQGRAEMAREIIKMIDESKVS